MPKYLNVSTLSSMPSLILSSNDVIFFSLCLLPNIIYWVFLVFSVNLFDANHSVTFTSSSFNSELSSMASGLAHKSTVSSAYRCDTHWMESLRSLL